MRLNHETEIFVFCFTSTPMSHRSIQLLFISWLYYFIYRTIIQSKIYSKNHLSLHFVLLILSSTCICLCFCKFTSYKNVIWMNHKLRKKNNLVFFLFPLIVLVLINFKKKKNTIQFTRFLLLWVGEGKLYAVHDQYISIHKFTI